MWLVIARSKKDKYEISGGEIYKRPTSSKQLKYGVYTWYSLLHFPRRIRKRIPKRVFYNWAVESVGALKGFKEFNSYSEAENYIMDQHGIMEMDYFTIEI